MTVQATELPRGLWIMSARIGRAGPGEFYPGRKSAFRTSAILEWAVLAKSRCTGGAIAMIVIAPMLRSGHEPGTH